MTLAICNFIRFKTRDGVYSPYAYQNFFVNETRSYQNVTYSFVPFGLTLGAGKKGGDRSNSALVAPPGPIGINIFAEACDNRWLLEVLTVEIDPLTLTLQDLISSELWFASSMETDLQRSVLQLSSPLDAVDGQIPRRFLSSTLVGALPSSGYLSFS